MKFAMRSTAGFKGENQDAMTNMKMDCFSGFGTASFIVGVFGFAMAAYAVKEIAGK